MRGAGTSSAGAAPASALQLLLPAAAPLLDAVRHLPGVALLPPPHVSLGYPWLPPEEALARLPDVQAAAARVEPFDALLSGPYAFAPDTRGRVVVHARLSPEEPVRALADALGADLRQVHLSLARVTRDGSVPAVLDALAPLLPRAVPVTVLELSVRPAGGTWSVAAHTRLGGVSGVSA